MNALEFQECAFNGLREFNRIHRNNNPSIRNAYIGQDDYCELMSTVVPYEVGMTKNAVVIYGFTIFTVNENRHFQLLIKE